MPQLKQDDLETARDLEGSVFDDTWSKLRRFGAGDSMGGLSPNPMGGMGVGVVRNEAHPAFQQLLKKAPREARHLRRARAVTQYADADAEQLAKIGGRAATIPMDQATVRQIVEAGGLRGVDLPTGAYSNLGQVPGSTLQIYPKGLSIAERTPVHEAGHALRFARSAGKEGTPRFSPEKAQQILDEAKRRGIRTGRYGGDIRHQALDALSQLRAEQGGFNVR